MKKIIVIMGGPSAEHEVSLATGQEILKHLDKSKYQPRSVIITRDKMFYYSDSALKNIPAEDFINPAASKQFMGPVPPAQSGEIWEGVVCAVLALHGEFGEDGRIQGFLETISIPYTGSNVFASAVSMEKIASKYLFEQHDITTPPYSVFRTNGSGASMDAIAEQHGFPCFVKCPQSGSSRLMGRADSRKELEKLLNEYSDYTTEILIETTITGDEYSVPVLEYPDGTVKTLLPILIRPVNAEFFDYKAKYTDGECEEIVPAPCSDDLSKRMQQISLKAHLILKCNGLSRTDMIVQDDTIYVLETNTLPGLTSASLAPKAFVATGGTYTQLLDILIETSIAGKK